VKQVSVSVGMDLQNLACVSGCFLKKGTTTLPTTGSKLSMNELNEWFTCLKIGMHSAELSIDPSIFCQMKNRGGKCLRCREHNYEFTNVHFLQFFHIYAYCNVIHMDILITGHWKFYVQRDKPVRLVFLHLC